MPARTIVHEIHVLAVHIPNHRRQRGPPDPDQAIAEFAVNTARLAGFIPSKHQPGTHKLREGYLILFTENYRGDYANIEFTVYHSKAGDCGRRAVCGSAEAS